MHPPWQTPLSPFHRETQKFFRPTTQRRWGALHVCIAWNIYYHKQLKEKQQIPKSLHPELFPECSLPTVPDSVQPTESHQPPLSSFVYPFGNPDNRSETGNWTSNMMKNRSYPSSSTSCDSQVSPSEEVGRAVKRLWRDKLDEREKDISKQKYLTRDFPGPKMIPGPDGGQSGSLCRKRQLECDSLQAKRVKKDYKDYPRDLPLALHSESPPLVRPHAHPSSHSVRMRNNRSTSSCVSYPDGRRCIVSHPCTELHPYQTPSRESNRSSGLDFCFVQQTPKGYLCNSFSAFHTPPPYFPFAPRQQETVHHRPTQSLPVVLSPLQMSASSSWPSGNILSGTGEFLEFA